MTKRYEVTHVPHYIGQRWVEPGEVVTLDPGITPGRWLKPVGEDAPTVTAGVMQFAAKHNGKGVGVGNYVVERVADGSYASRVFRKDDGQAKELAEAEAERLNAGGEIAQVASDGAPSSGLDELGTSTHIASGSGLPDA
jgi:hypothetical protein